MVGQGLHRVAQRDQGPPTVSRALSAPCSPASSATTTCGCPRCGSHRPNWPAKHGVHGFVYYHYWFHGRRLLERPFEEVLASGVPDFPFALCWANEEWTRGWDSQTGHVLVRQEFSEEDDRAHIRDLLRAFKDPRYITIDGRPLMLIYRPTLIPDLVRTSEIWRQRCRRPGSPISTCAGSSHGGLLLVARDRCPSVSTPPSDSCPCRASRSHPALETLRGHRVLDYQSAAESAIELLDSPWKRFPSVMVGWDNTARRARAATIYHGATPARYEHWLRVTADSLADVRPEENYLFILAWNEWAEGNHLEPDQRYGRAFLEATRSVLLDEPRFHIEHPPLAPRQPTTNSAELAGTGAASTRPVHPRRGGGQCRWSALRAGVARGSTGGRPRRPGRDLGAGCAPIAAASTWYLAHSPTWRR